MIENFENFVEQILKVPCFNHTKFRFRHVTTGRYVFTCRYCFKHYKIGSAVFNKGIKKYFKNYTCREKDFYFHELIKNYENIFFKHHIFKCAKKTKKMKLFINNQLFDTEKDVVVLTLTQEEKDQISQMADDNFYYCAAPDNKTEEDLLQALKNSQQAVSLFSNNNGI